MNNPSSLVTALLLLFLFSGEATAQASGKTVWLPMVDEGFFGARNIKLEATLFRPPGDGPFPVVIFNHGSSGGPIPPGYTDQAAALGAFLVSKEIALIVPMRRGRGRSEGSNREEPSECTLEAAKKGLQYASGAVDAAYAYLRQERWASLDRVILAGHSRGGILASDYAAKHAGASLGVINFSGGWKNDHCGPVDVNASIFQQAGAGARVPNLFLYAYGDAFYTDDSMRNYGAVFKAAGGDITFKLLAVEKINGHQLFHRGQAAWESSVNDFLDRLHVGLRAPPKLK